MEETLGKISVVNIHLYRVMVMTHWSVLPFHLQIKGFSNTTQITHDAAVMRYFAQRQKVQGQHCIFSTLIKTSGGI